MQATPEIGREWLGTSQPEESSSSGGIFEALKESLEVGQVPSYWLSRKSSLLQRAPAALFSAPYP